MPKKNYYIVTGRGPFPTDMLRYDSATIVARGTLPVLKVPAYLIYGECTAARWRSFLWTTWKARGPGQWQVEIGPRHWETIDLRNEIVDWRTND